MRGVCSRADAPAARHVLDRRARSRHRRGRRRGAVALVLGRLAVHLGAARRRRGRHAVGRGARAWAARARPAGGRGATPRRRSPACCAADPLAAVRQVGVVDARGGVAVHTGAECIPEAGDVTGEHWTCQANMMARATVPDAMSAAFARGGRRPRRAAHDRAGGRRGRGRRRPRPPVGRARSSRPAQGEPWQARDRPARRGPRRPDRRAAPPARPPARVRARRRGRRADGRGPRRRGRRRATCARPSSRPTPTSCCSGPGSRSRRAATSTAGADAVRRAASVHPGWLTLLERLSPEFAPSGAAVRARRSVSSGS